MKMKEKLYVNEKGNEILVILEVSDKSTKFNKLYNLKTFKNGKLADIIEMDKWFDLEEEFEQQVRYSNGY